MSHCGHAPHCPASFLLPEAGIPFKDLGLPAGARPERGSPQPAARSPQSMGCSKSAPEEESFKL